MVKTIKSKKAIAMIELIFALVIMGIVLMSAPMLIQQSIKSSNIALQQEAIVAAASQTAIVLSMNWDENNSKPTAGESPILDTNKSLSGLDGVYGRNKKKEGNVTLFPSIIIGADANETDYKQFDDVDDYDGSSFGLVLFNNESSSADKGDYLDVSIEINTTVRYTQDTNVSVDIPVGIPYSDVKAIQVRLTSNLDKNDANYTAELEKDITFKAFSCNIGTYSIDGKELL